MQYVRCRHIKEHAIFDLLDDNPDSWFDIIYVINDKQYGLAITEMIKVDKQYLKNQQYRQRITQVARTQMERLAYKLYYQKYPDLTKEGQVLAQGGRMCVINGKKDYKEGLVKISS